MPKPYSIFLFIWLFPYIFLSKENVQALIALFRHGARKPMKNLPNLPIFPNEIEQEKDLSPMGIRRQFNLGQMLRNNYPDLFPETYSYHSLNMTASETKRTISSAMSQISGMFRDRKGFDIDTPKNPMNYSPQWNGEQATPGFIGDSGLPNGMVLAPILSYNENTNFLFKADQTCDLIKQESDASFQNQAGDLFEVLADAYKVFQKNHFSIQEVYGDKEIKDSFEKFGEISDALTSLLYRDPQNRLENFTFSQQAHMVFVNSLYIYSRFSKNSMRRYYLTPLVREWIEILESFTHLVPEENSLQAVINDVKFSKIQLFYGHQENISALLLELFDEFAVLKIEEQYAKFKDKANLVENQEQFDDFLQAVIEDYPITHLEFGANLIFELVSTQNIGKIYFYF